MLKRFFSAVAGLALVVSSVWGGSQDRIVPKVTGFVRIRESIQFESAMPKTEMDLYRDRSTQEALFHIQSCQPSKDSAGDPLMVAKGQLHLRASLFKYSVKRDPEGDLSWTVVLSGNQTRAEEMEDVLTIDPVAKTYSVSVPGGMLSGQSIVTIRVGKIVDIRTQNSNTSVGGGTHEDYKGNVYDVPFNPKTRVIRGRYAKTYRAIFDGIGAGTAFVPVDPTLGKEFLEAFDTVPVRKEIEWCFFLDTKGPKAVIEPVGAFQDWLPGPGKSLSFKVKITEPTGAKGTFRFRLDNTSKAAGESMNHPARDQADTEPDFRIVAGGRTLLNIEPDGQKASASDKSAEAELKVECRDYGGFATLVAEVEVATAAGIEVVPAVFQKSGTPFVKLPFDENLNDIADKWEKDVGYQGSGIDDVDADPGSADLKGDGLSAYEEYRGFYVGGSHVRFDPKKKDLFVYDPNGWLAASPFQSATAPLHVRYVQPGEMDLDGAGNGSRVVNFNNLPEFHLVDQHGLRIKTGSTDYGFGESVSSHPSFDENPGPPRTCDWILVDPARMEASLKKFVDENRDAIEKAIAPVKADAAWFQGHLRSMFAYIAAHEFSHGVGVCHHSGEEGEGAPDCLMNWPASGSEGFTLFTVLIGRYAWPTTLCRSGDNCYGQICVNDLLGPRQ